MDMDSSPLIPYADEQSKMVHRLFGCGLLMIFPLFCFGKHVVSLVTVYCLAVKRANA